MELAVAMRHTHTIATAKCRDAQRVLNAGGKRQPPVFGVVDAYLLKMVQGEDGASACLETSESRSPQGGQGVANVRLHVYSSKGPEVSMDVIGVGGRDATHCLLLVDV